MPCDRGLHFDKKHCRCVCDEYPFRGECRKIRSLDPETGCCQCPFVKCPPDNYYDTVKCRCVEIKSAVTGGPATSPVF